MSTIGPEGRSYEVITLSDLQRLADIAEQDRLSFFSFYPDWAKQYQDRVLGVALCQGAAMHFVDKTTGVQDFDVYTFYARHPARPWYAKRMKHGDFGLPKFGKSHGMSDYVGRRVDLMGRSLDVPPGTDPAIAIRTWLASGRPGSSAGYLATKAVVLLSPHGRRGEVVWP